MPLLSGSRRLWVQKLTHSQSQRHFCFDFTKRHKVQREVPRTNGFGPAFRKQNFRGLHFEWTERIERRKARVRLPTLVRSGLILRSPRRVSRKREFSWIRLETFGNFCPKKCEGRSPETFHDKKARIWRAFLVKKRKFSQNTTAWLTWEDSNFHITISKNAFEMSIEFLLFWPKTRLGDFCSCKLWK